MKPNFPFRIAFSVLLTACFFSTAIGQQNPTSQWAQFRGTQGTGVADANAKPPTKWDPSSQTVWEADIPGTGWSSPVYEGDKVWLTSAVTQAATEEEIAEKLKNDPMAKIKTLAASLDLHAICVDANTGDIIHNIKLVTVDSPEPINPMNTYASPTPAIRNGKVICHFGNYGTWCIDENSGDVLWDEKFVVKHSVGPGSSPVIFGDKVIIVCDGTDLQFIVAVELETGNQIWKTDRPPFRTNNGEFRKAYCTPILIEANGSQQIIIPGAQWIAGYDPESGEELWRADHGDGFSIATMPVYESGLVVFSTGYMKGELVAIDPTGTGDVTKSAIAWRARNAPKMPSLIAQNGQIFMISEKGILACLDAKTGNVINRHRLGGNFSSSPILAGGNLYLSSREGVMSVVKCSSDFTKVASNKFDGSLMASPILFGNDLLVRTENKLVRVTGSAQ